MKPLLSPLPTPVLVRTDALDLATYAWGDPNRPMVVLLHGYPDQAGVWAELAERLAQRFRVIAYDVRGAGASGTPVGAAGYDLARLADDALAVLDAVSPDRAVHLVGHDWGSVQGWDFATSPRFAGRLASFTSISGPSLDQLGSWVRDRRRRPTPRAVAGLIGQGRRSWYVAAIRTPLLPDLLWRTGLASRLARRLGAPTATAADGRHGLGLYRRNVGRRLRDPNPTPALIPVCLVVPTQDKFVSPRVHDDLGRWAPSLRRHTIDGGHWIQCDQPDRLNDVIGDFVDDVEHGRATGDAPAGMVERGRSFGGALVLVTGAGSGIGRATAIAFADAGATVLLVDRDPTALAATESLLATTGSIAASHLVDVGDGAAMTDLAAKVRAEHGVPDILVNNAGIGLAGPFLQTTAADWERVLSVNLWGVLHGCQAFAGAMAERGSGQIVNVASAAAFQPAKDLSAYSTSKAAVLMLSECLRAELAAHGVGVTAICPGIVNTNITSSTRFVGLDPVVEAAQQQRTTRLYRRRNYSPDKVAAAILRAVATNAAVVPVTIEAKAMRALSRVSPSVLRRLARLDVLSR